MPDKPQPARPRLVWQRTLPYVLLAAGLVGMLASFMLTSDKLHLLQDPSYQPPCNLNPVISCSAVMKTPQASTFGVPNSVYGLMIFSGLTMFAIALLAGAKFKRWLWLSAQLLATGGIIAMHYLFFQDVFRIHAICPWCFSVWMVSIPAFWGLTVYNLRRQISFTAPRWLVRLASTVDKYNRDILVLWYLIIFAILLTKFWYYWKTIL